MGPRGLSPSAPGLARASSRFAEVAQDRATVAPGLAMILVESEDLAVDIRERLLAGESIDTLARLYSVDPSASAGGFVGFLDTGSLRTELRSVVETLGPGEVGPIVRLDDAYGLLRVLSDAERRWFELRQSASAAAGDRDSERGSLLESALSAARVLDPPDSRLAMSLLQLGEYRRSVGDVEGAINLLAESLEVWDGALGPGREETLGALNRLGDIHLAEGNYAEAAAFFGRSLAILERVRGLEHSDVAATLNALGLIAHLSGDNTEARTFFERALRIWEAALGPEDPNVAAVLGNLATVDIEDGRFAAADARLSRSIDIQIRTFGRYHPDVSDHLRRLAEVRGLQEDWAAAENLFVQALDARWATVSDPTSSVLPFLDRLVDVLDFRFRADAAAEAERAFIDALTDPRLGEDLLVAAAGVLETESRTDLAGALLDRALERFPGSRRVRFRLANLASSSGRVPAAIEQLERSRGLDGPPGLGQVLVREGDLYLEIDRDEDARRAYAEALEVDPAIAAASIGLGEVALRAGRVEDALGDFAEAARRDPGSAMAHYRLSEAQLRLGRPADAADSAARALELDPEHRRVRYVRGRALIEIGRVEEGREDLAVFAALEQREREENLRVLELAAIQSEAREAVARGELDRAAELLETAVAEHPDAYWPALGLASLEGLRGRADAAVRTLEAMIQRGIGDDPVVRRHLARAHAALGHEEARVEHAAMARERLLSMLESASAP